MMASESTLVGSYHGATKILVTKKLNPPRDDLGAELPSDPWAEGMKIDLRFFSGRTSQPLPFSLSLDDESKHGMRAALGFQNIRRFSHPRVEIDELQNDDYDVQLSLLPKTEDIHLVVENTEPSDLKWYAVEVTDIAIGLVRTSSAHLGAVKRLNDCFATLGKILELGDDLEEIESKRRRRLVTLPAGRSRASSEHVVRDDIPVLYEEYHSVVETLRSSGREISADKVAAKIQSAAENPDEPEVNLSSLQEMAEFLTKHEEYASPVVGTDPQGIMQVEWRFDGNGLLVVAFLGEGTAHCVALSDATPERSEMNESVQLNTDAVAETFGELIPKK